MQKYILMNYNTLFSSYFWPCLVMNVNTVVNSPFYCQTSAQADESALFTARAHNSVPVNL